MSSYADNYINFLQSSDKRNEVEVQSNCSGDSTQVDITKDLSDSQDTSQAASTYVSYAGTATSTNTAGMGASTGLPAARILLLNDPPNNHHIAPGMPKDVLVPTKLPPVSEQDAQCALSEISRLANIVKNNNSNNDDWVDNVIQHNWTIVRKDVFKSFADILDKDRLGRLTVAGNTEEVSQIRAIVDKSAARARRLFASLHWETEMMQWLHKLMLEYLPPYALESYLDIMQTLNSKLPVLIERALFVRSLEVGQELLAPIIRDKWEPVPMQPCRELEHSAIILAIPNMFIDDRVPKRTKRWYSYFSDIGNVVPLTLTNTSGRLSRMSITDLLELLVSAARVKLQEIRSENPDTKIILLGFNAGASLALQIACSEYVSCIVCVGFSYNTINGPRGAPDDCILDIEAPILFVIGQNSQSTSRDEIEALREKMVSRTSLVIVGGADESLRIPKSKRRMDKCTQAVADLLISEEIFEFVSCTLDNPPGPRTLKPTIVVPKSTAKSEAAVIARSHADRKRKSDTPLVANVPAPKIKPIGDLVPGRPRNNNNNSNIGGTVAVGALGMIGASSISVATTTATVAQSPALSNGVVIKRIAPPTTAAVVPKRYKLLQPNQSIQIKPIPSRNNNNIGALLSNQQQQRTGGNNCSVTNINQQQIFTLKAPNGQTSQFVTAAPPSAVEKYTIVKEANGTTSVQYKKKESNSKELNLNTGSIIDLASFDKIPIAIADNDGNITDVPVNNRIQVPGVRRTGATVSTKGAAAPTIIKIPNATNVSNGNKILIQKQVNMPAILQRSVNGGNRFVFLNKGLTSANTSNNNNNNNSNNNITTSQLPKFVINQKAVPTTARITPFTPQQVKHLKKPPTTLMPIGTSNTSNVRPIINIDSSRLQMIDKSQIINTSNRKFTPIVGNFKPALSTQLSTELYQRNVMLRKVIGGGGGGGNVTQPQAGAIAPNTAAAAQVTSNIILRSAPVTITRRVNARTVNNGNGGGNTGSENHQSQPTNKVDNAPKIPDDSTPRTS